MSSSSNKQLLDYKPLKSWMDFNRALSLLDSKRKGDAFELLCKYYFILHPKNEHINREKVWLLSEVPVAVKKELSIGEDTGFDLLLQDKTGNYIPVQCKYHSDPKKNLSWDEASTFFGRYYANDTYNEAYICTSAYGVSRHYQDAKTKPVIRVMGTDFQKLDEEFFNQVRAYREGKKASYKPYSPRPHQQKAIKDAKKHFLKDNHARGKLIFPCGSGKSLTGFWLTQELKAKSIVVAVPSLSLVKQTLEVYLREIVANKKQVEWLCICSEGDIGASAEVKFELAEVGVPCTTDEEAIKSWLERTNGTQRIIFTTYQSGRLIGQISKALGQSFDLGIFDESHKTVGSTSKLFSYLLREDNINISKRIFMTATERFYQGSKDDIASMDDIDIYGEIFTHMSFKDAIEQNLLTDYKVITIDVSKAEIATFIRDNKLVELSKEYGKEAEARSLASMLALRKAMKSFGIKNAVSFHSSIRKAQNASQVQDYISKHYDFKPIDSFTVDGKMATGKREVIINEFADSPKALITNARCLTEGVDVPNIDCIVFADPRRSKIDIVQALGRALRKKEGKEWGYVIIPVVYDGDTHEIDNDNFKEIIGIIRGLAANDERIIDHFKDKNSLEKSGGGQLTEEQFMFLTETLDESEFKGQLGIKLWEGLSRFTWLPFEEARKFVHSLKLTSAKDYQNFISRVKDIRIPLNPRGVYKNSGFISMPDFVGYDSYFKEFLEFREAKNYLKDKELSSVKAYWEHLNSHPNLALPHAPWKVYSEYWEEGGGWSGYLNKMKSPQELSKDYLSFEDARNFIHRLELKTGDDWNTYKDSDDFPNFIPKAPQNVYSEFKGNEDWIGPTFIPRNARWKLKYLSFEEAKRVVAKENFKNEQEFKKWSNRPDNIPSKPRQVYSKEWKGIRDFLGADSYFQDNLNYEDAKALVQKSSIGTAAEYQQFVGKNRNLDLPSNPERVYGDEWKFHNGWYGFLGKEKVIYNYIDYFQLAFTCSQKGIKTKMEYTRWAKSLDYTFSQKRLPSNPRVIYGEERWSGWSKFFTDGEFISQLPVTPDRVYSLVGWDDWSAFLGTKQIATQGREYVSYQTASNFAKSEGIRSGKDWLSRGKLKTLPNGFPLKPNIIYKRTGEWESWGVFLQTGRIADHLKVWRDFEKAKDYARALKLKSVKDWVVLANSGNLPSDIPKKPQETYLKKGWKDFGDWLGIENARSSGKRKWRDFNEARKWVRGQNLSSHTWRSFVKRQDFPKDIPMAPDKVYNNQGWIDWSDFLGTGNVQGKLAYKSFKDARIFVRGLGLKSQREWFEFAKTSEKPIDIPTAVVSKYKDDGWKGWKDFLGTDKAE